MGDYRLNTYVYAVEVDDKGTRTGREVMFGPDDNLSAPENEWALAAITNDDVWAGDKPDRRPPPAAPTGNQDETAALRARIAELEAEKSAAIGELQPPAVPKVEVPPMRGPGSGAPDWRAYARSQQVDVADDASRDDVVNALTAAGKTTTR